MELANRPQLEASFRRRIEKLSAKHRKRLKQLAGDPPDLSKVPASFWQEVESELDEQLAIALLLIFAEAGEQTGASRAGLLSRGDAFARSRASEVARGYVEHSIERFQNGASIRDVFGKGRAAVIAKTETSVAQEEGNATGAAESQLTLIKVWSHTGHRPKGHAGAAVKPCPICTPLEGLSEREWQRINPVSGPPSHPFCDCFLTYFDAATGEPWPIGTPEPTRLNSDEIRAIRRALRN